MRDTPTAQSGSAPVHGEKPEHAEVPGWWLTDERIGRWLSAALEDPAVCEEMKADIREWFKSSDGSEAAGGAIGSRGLTGDPRKCQPSRLEGETTRPAEVALSPSEADHWARLADWLKHMHGINQSVAHHPGMDKHQADLQQWEEMARCRVEGR